MSVHTKSILLTHNELDQLFDKNGMKYRYARLHNLLASHGLLPHVTKEKFVSEMYKILSDFFVKGMCEDENGKTSISTDS